eukprot:scaffold40433_cov20-Prasinocladus_malaysianus.AAC.1
MEGHIRQATDVFTLNMASKRGCNTLTRASLIGHPTCERIIMHRVQTYTPLILSNETAAEQNRA